MILNTEATVVNVAKTFEILDKSDLDNTREMALRLLRSAPERFVLLFLLKSFSQIDRDDVLDPPTFDTLSLPNSNLKTTLQSEILGWMEANRDSTVASLTKAIEIKTTVKGFWETMFNLMRGDGRVTIEQISEQEKLTEAFKRIQNTATQNEVFDAVQNLVSIFSPQKRKSD